MNRTAQRYAGALTKLCAGLEQKDVSTIIDQFARLLIERRQASLLPEIMEAVERIPEPGTVRVKLTTAGKAPKETASEFSVALEKKLGSKVEVETDEDPNIIGGAVIRYEDTLLDASVRNRLNILKHRLQSSEL